MAFTDETVVFVHSGRGGDGSASFHSEPYKPRGGPDGGDGGDGGSIVLQVAHGVRDLSDLAAHPHRRADNGKPGRNANRNGGRAKDLIIPVPDGTVVSDERGFVADLVGEGARVVVARGGRGGRGNTAFAGPKNKAPRRADPGEEGEEHRLELELRSIADVGLVGLPNAGKSTLLAALTAARPKIANYPFTTLDPNIGVAVGEERFVLADVPGLIEGAHAGRGLGDRFLRHVSRCRILAYVVDLAVEDPISDLKTVRAEVAAYATELAERPSIVVGTHSDMLDDHYDRRGIAGEVLVVSGTTGEGIDALAERLADLTSAPVVVTPSQAPRAVVLRPGREEFTVSREGPGFRVSGHLIERLVAAADFDDDEDVEKLQKRLIKEGIEKALAEAGARIGDDVTIGGMTFEFIPEGE